MNQYVAATIPGGGLCFGSVPHFAEVFPGLFPEQGVFDGFVVEFPEVIHHSPWGDALLFARTSGVSA